jgi:hypothetical protein
MLVNGFAFSTVEIGRHSLFMITIATTQNVVSAVIGKCNKSLFEVTNAAYMYLRNMLFKDMEEKGMAGDKGTAGDEGGGERGGAWSSGIMVKSLDKEIKNIIKEGEKAAGIDIVGLTVEMAESKYVSEGVGARIILIMFLIFIFGIIRRKGRIGSESNDINKWKARISA